MPVTSVEEGLLVTYVLRIGARTGTTKVWLRTNNLIFGTTTGALQSVVDQMAGNFAPFMGAVSADATLADVRLTDMRPLDGSGTEVHSTSTPVGTTGSGGDAAPFASSALITLHAAARGRSHQNRMFIPFIGEGIVQDGHIDDASYAALIGFANTFRTTSESTIQGWRIAILRRKGHPAGRTGVVEDCDSSNASQRVAYQLRRSR